MFLINCVIVCTKTIVNYQNHPNLAKKINFIGVEQGCLDLLDKLHQLPVAIGDFDQLNTAELALVKQRADIFKAFSADKDLIDGELAIQYAESHYSQPHILFIAEGAGWDFILATCFLMRKYNFTFQNSVNYAWKLHAGLNEIRPIAGYQKISFIAWSRAQITIQGLAYQANNMTLEPLAPLAMRNYFLPKATVAQVTVHRGEVLVFYAKS